MRNRLTSLFLVFWTMWGFACGPEPQIEFIQRSAATTEVSREMVGGQLDTRFDAVGALTSARSAHYIGSFCSATLIRPGWVLTAAHCLDELTLQSLGPTIEFAVGADVQPTAAGRRPRNADFYELDEWYIHPSFRWDGQVIQGGIDIALARLKTEVSGVQPIDISYAFPSDNVQHPGLVMGYGVTDPNTDAGAGSKRSKELKFAWATFDGAIGLDSNDGGVCFGDSGGATLVFDEQGQPKLVGVISAASDAQGNPCIGISYVTMPFLELEWLGNLLDESLGCQFDSSVCGCEGVCREDGTCNDLACGVTSCSGALQCSRDCLANTDCHLSCDDTLAVESLDYFQTLSDCASRCGTLHDESDAFCIENLCAEQLEMCMLDEEPCGLLGGDCEAGTACQQKIDANGAVETSQCESSQGLSLAESCTGEGVECIDGASCVDGRCQTNCLSDDDCGEGRICSPIPNAEGLGTCWQPCDPLARECEQTDACVKYGDDWVCAPSLGASFDETCDAAQGLGVCADRTACVDGRCAILCKNAEDCPADLTCTGPVVDASSGIATCSTSVEISTTEEDPNNDVGDDTSSDADGCAQSKAGLWMVFLAIGIFVQKKKRSIF